MWDFVVMPKSVEKVCDSELLPAMIRRADLWTPLTATIQVRWHAIMCANKWGWESAIWRTEEKGVELENAWKRFLLNALQPPKSPNGFACFSQTTAETNGRTQIGPRMRAVILGAPSTLPQMISQLERESFPVQYFLKTRKKGWVDFSPN